jgi:hypothetical protein
MFSDVGWPKWGIDWPKNEPAPSLCRGVWCEGCKKGLGDVGAAYDEWWIRSGSCRVAFPSNGLVRVLSWCSLGGRLPLSVVL